MENQGVDVTATVWTPWCGKLMKYCNVFFFIATQWYCHWKTWKDGDMVVGWVALRPDAVQGRRRRPAKWNWKRFFRRIDRIRLYEKRRHDNTRETTPKRLLSDLPSISNAYVVEKKRPQFLFVCSLGAGKQKKKVKREGMKSWKSSCGLSRMFEDALPVKSPLPPKHGGRNQLIFQRRRGRQRTTTTMGRSSSSLLSRSAEENITQWETTAEMSREADQKQEHVGSGGGGGGVNAVLHSTVNFKDVMPTNWVQKHPMGDWTSRQLDQIDAEAFHSETSPGNLEESRQKVGEKTQEETFKKNKIHSDFC